MNVVLDLLKVLPESSHNEFFDNFFIHHIYLETKNSNAARTMKENNVQEVSKNRIKANLKKK